MHRKAFARPMRKLEGVRLNVLNSSNLPDSHERPVSPFLILPRVEIDWSRLFTVGADLP